MSNSDSREAWGQFWAAGGAGPASGCLPNAEKLIDEVQQRVWAHFARMLPRSAKVLDLATGDGVVLAKMKSVRRDLKLLGIDSSPVLPPSRQGLKLKPGVPMEELPFGDKSFDAVTSQFGFEYGRTDKVASEVQRVLRPGGALQFVVHYRDGPILAHNRPRRAALAWASRESGYLQKAKAFVRLRHTSSLPTPPLFRHAAEDAKSRFPKQPVAAEFLTAIFQTLEFSRHVQSVSALGVLEELEAKAQNEIARVDSLEGAACDVDGMARIVSELEAAGLNIDAPTQVRESELRSPFAWLLTGRKPRM